MTEEPKTLLNDAQLGEAMKACPAPRVTEEGIRDRISKTEFQHLTETVTLCTITLDNGYSVRGESACVSPENYRQEIGEAWAYKNAFQKLWPLFGFLLAEHLWQVRHPAENTAEPEQAAA